MNQWMKERMNEWNEWMNEWMVDEINGCERTNKPMKDWLTDWLTEGRKEGRKE